MSDQTEKPYAKRRKRESVLLAILAIGIVVALAVLMNRVQGML